MINVNILCIISLSNHSSCLSFFLSGTGKTATVLATINALRKDVTAGKLPDFSFIEINCLRLKSPADACECIFCLCLFPVHDRISRELANCADHVNL